MINELRSICKNLKAANEDILADKVLFVIGALTDSETPRSDLSYSYVMRKLRKDHKDKVREFQTTFKKAFEDALDEDLDEPDNIALLAALKAIDIEID